MPASKLPSPDVYYGISGITDSRYRRYWPIESPGDFKIRHVPTVSPGDIVKWKPEVPGSQLFETKTLGLVLASRWCRADWISNREEFLIPEAFILWNDGDTTNSEHGSLILFDSEENIDERSES